ncbi:MAG: alpha/beta hydrolase [Chromatiales bacterium]|jgi:2-hydroxy-6-oxonona-2,4-dienedioate hydrolase|nr:alpha/beta hydrolase [Chromatiales bacterium]
MLNYRRLGTGPSLVLQHGFLGGSGYWEPQFAMFGRHFNVVAPDLPGFAGSAGSPVPDTLEGFAAALVGLLDQLGVERTMLLGHSMGSMVSLQIALDYPERVDRLVLYGSASTGNLADRFEPVEASIERIETHGVDATADHIVPTWFVAGNDAPFATMCRDAGRGATTEATTRALRAISGWDVTDRLHEITAPVLIICGDRDRSTSPDHSFRLRKALANSELCVVPGCAHNVHLERPELFSSVVLDFLTRN